MSSSSYKQSALKSQLSFDSSDQFHSETLQLQELFPSWSNDDLHSLLAEVGGDIQLAATRISEGYAEQWGSVTRKKEKKPQTPSYTHSRDSPPKHEFRATKAARGGRGGGPARGTSASRHRGPPRGPPSGTNGHLSRPNNSPALSPAASWADVAHTPDESDKASVGDGSVWSAKQDGQTPPAPATATTTSWGDPSSQETPTAPTWAAPTSASTWGVEPELNGSPSRSPPAQPKPPKNPATSKLSWAEVARVQEKPPAPAPVPIPVSLPPPPPDSPPFQPTPSSPTSQLQPDPLPDSESQHPGWEEPTTIQPHSWEDEPQPTPLPSNVWLSSIETHPEESQTSQKEEIPEPVAPDPLPEPLPIQLQSPPQDQKPELPLPAPSKQTPPATHTRASTSHRNSARYKTIDQPVVLPSSFGSGIEKVGMQFGSLSLGGENLFDSIPPEPPAETPPRAPETALPEPTQVPRVPTPRHSDPSPVAPPAVPAPHNAGTNLFQQSQTPSQHMPHHQHSLPTSVSQSAVQAHPQAPSHAAAATSPMQQFAQQSVAQQQALATHHLPQQQQPQPPNQAQIHSQYPQHRLPAHIDPTQNQTPHSPQHIPPTQPQQNASTHSTYFRQAEAPYFHTPTPPVGQTQDSPYGAFGPLGQQGQHQAQPSHMGGFGGGEYGYGDGQRGFYESYAQQSGFNRNILGHDDVKGLPTQQPPPSGAGLPPSGAQASQQHPPAAQGAGQPQPGAGQGPQQGYPPPVPYYYNPYPQNQYYGSPYNSAYGVPQPYVKYPAMFQPGPPGPGSAPSPAGKQGPNVPPQSNPYGQGLYAQHPSASYDEIGYQHHTQQHQQHNLTHTQGVAANLPSADYAKQHQQLYNAQGMQGFMGLGQNTGPSSGPPIGQRTSGSPETPYKPYAPNVGVKDVGAGVGVGQPGVGQGPPGRAGVQPQPQHTQGGFYGANRFASNAGTGPQGQQATQLQNQGQAPQGHIGYPQGGNDGNFYSYQPRQQGYWQ